jgi:hypothetical protein
VVDAANDLERVAARLFGANWRDSCDFPRYHSKPSAFTWTDFRSIGDADRSSNGWVAKAYVGALREKHIETRPEEPNRIAKIYEEVLCRDIFLVRWHTSGLLELRVPAGKTQKALLVSMRGLWTAIEPAIRSDDFEPLDLTPVCLRIIDQHGANSEEYRLGNAHFLDPAGGTTKVSARSSEEHLMDVETRKRAVQLFDRCRMLVVAWLLDEERYGIGGELRTVIGRLRPNEVLIVARTMPKVVDHVTHRLCQIES